MQFEKRSEKEKINPVEEGITLLVGSVFYAVGFHVFVAPCRLVLGGATGVATLLNHLLALPIGWGVFLVNLPLFLWNLLRFGRHKTMRVFIGIAATSLFLELFAVLPYRAVPALLGAVLGGVTMAVGIALLLRRGYTTGGSELAATLLKERFSLLTVGKTVLLIDTAVVLITVFCMKEANALFPSVLLNLSFAVVLDLVLEGQQPKRSSEK